MGTGGITRRRSTLVVVLALATAASGAAVYGAATRTAAAQPVAGALQGSFVANAGGLEAAPTAFDEQYDGELLTVQAEEVGRRAAEPTIGVTTDGAAFFAAADFDGVSPAGARTVLLRSLEGGVEGTWESVQTSFPVGETFPPVNLDPYVWVDTATDRIFNVDLTGCGTLQYSDDRGETFTTREAACGDSVDHQTLFGGPPPPAGLPQLGDYPNRIYYCSNRPLVDSRCSRSLDGGDTWLTTATPAYPAIDPAEEGICNGLHGHGIVDPEGRIILPKGHCGWPYVAVSEDGGDTWMRQRVSDEVMSGEILIPPFEYAGTYQHTSVASDSEGNLYYVWPGQDRRAYLAVSRDSGATWGPAINITPPGVTEVNFPTIAAGSEGRIAVILVGGFAEDPPGATGSPDDDDDPTNGNNNPALKRPWNYYVMASTDALADDPRFLVTTANNPDDPIHRGDCFQRCGGMFDFLDVIVAPSGELWATASDTCVQESCQAQDGSVDPDAVGVGIAIRQLGGPLLVDPAVGPPEGPDGSEDPTTSEEPTGSEDPTDRPDGTEEPTAAPSEGPTGSESPTDRPPAEPDDTEATTVRRLAGPQRIATAIEISRDSYEDGQAGAVVLARADVFADALAGTPLAVDREAPLLLTSSDRLDDAVAAEIERVLPRGAFVYLLGGTAALSDAVAAEVDALGYRPVRYGGANRFATAVAIAEQGLGSPDTLLVASGGTFADAVSAGAAAGHAGGALLLTSDASMPAETQAHLDGNRDAVRFAVGGPAAAADPDATPIVGATRTHTAVAVATEFFAVPEVAGIATAEDFPDALAGGAQVGARGGPLLLSGSDALPEEVVDYLEEHRSAIDDVRLYGGTQALSESVEEAVADAVARP